VKKHKLSVIHGDIKTCLKCGESSLQLTTDSEQKIETSRVILATGFEGNMKHLSWLQNVIKREKLLCADCGFPIVSKNLEWKKNLYVVGALSELEVGPTARNISGARTAASKIINSI
jgi:lysine/ornithine N-monooxygenase